MKKAKKVILSTIMMLIIAVTSIPVSAASTTTSITYKQNREFDHLKFVTTKKGKKIISQSTYSEHHIFNNNLKCKVCGYDLMARTKKGQGLIYEPHKKKSIYVKKALEIFKQVQKDLKRNPNDTLTQCFAYWDDWSDINTDLTYMYGKDAMKLIKKKFHLELTDIKITSDKVMFKYLFAPHKIGKNKKCTLCDEKNL